MKKLYVALCLLLLIMIYIWANLTIQEPLKIGATYMNMNNPYFITLHNSLSQTIETNGDMLLVRDPSMDQSRQNEIIYNFIEEEIDVLIIQPADWKAVSPALEACAKADIPVFVVDSLVYDADDVVCNVLSDNYKAGVEIAKDLMANRQSGEVLLVSDQDIYSNQQRIAGLLDTLDDSRFHVIHSVTDVEGLEAAMAATEICIAEGIYFDVAIGGNDPTALGILAALEKNEVGHEIDIYGVDGSPDMKLMIAKGYIAGTSAQNPTEIGRITAENIYRYLDGESIEKEVLVDVYFINPENISNYNIAGW